MECHGVSSFIRKIIGSSPIMTHVITDKQLCVIAGLDPAIYQKKSLPPGKTFMPGTRIELARRLPDTGF